MAAFFAWTSYYEIRNADLAFWGATEIRWGDGAIAVWELRRPTNHSEIPDLEAYLLGKGLIDRLTKFEIPGDQFRKASTDLGLMNLRYSTLFPDLEGAAKQANIDAVTRLFSHIEGVAHAWTPKSEG